MDGAAIEPGAALICGGDDVLKELNDVFGDPASAKYQYAQSHNTFGAIQNVAGNYKALIDAYLAFVIDTAQNIEHSAARSSVAQYLKTEV
jgi:hypothetical protein